MKVSSILILFSLFLNVISERDNYCIYYQDKSDQTVLSPKYCNSRLISQDEKNIIEYILQENNIEIECCYVTAKVSREKQELVSVDVCTPLPKKAIDNLGTIISTVTGIASDFDIEGDVKVDCKGSSIKFVFSLLIIASFLF